MPHSEPSSRCESRVSGNQNPEVLNSAHITVARLSPTRTARFSTTKKRSS
ncbi:MAG: hypothetical protein IPJ65_17725 [Archangiaceae bacterium]|nr:hypothetical protein [Archangiaceae bacterium]